MRAAAAAVLALALSGCVESSCRLGWPGVSAVGPPCTVSGGSYARLSLAGPRPDGTPWTPYHLRMPDGRVLAHWEITPTAVAPYDPLERIAGRTSPVPSDGVRAFLALFEADGRLLGTYRFRFEGERLDHVDLIASSSGADARGPSVAGPGGGPPVPLPFSERDLVDQFGPWHSHEDWRRILIVRVPRTGPMQRPAR